MHEAADPERRRDLVDAVQHEQHAARLQACGRVAGPRRRPHQHGRHPDHHPSEAGLKPAGRTPAAQRDRADGERHAGRDPDRADLHVERPQRGPERPRRVVEQHEQLDAEGEGLPEGQDRRRGPDQPERPGQRGRIEARARGGRAQHQQHEDHAAHRHRLRGQDEAAQQNVEEAGHVRRPAAAARPTGPAA